MSDLRIPGRVAAASGASSVRRVELVAGLSLAADLGMGQPPEHALRACVVATGLGRQVGLEEDELRCVFYVALLRWLGCTANAHETAVLLGGDDLAPRTEMAVLDATRPADAARFVGRFAGAAPPEAEAWKQLAGAHCESAEQLADWLELGPGVRRGVGQVLERWDGHGLPHGLAGDAISPAARLARLAGDAEIFHRLGGARGATAAVRERAGRVYDPGYADAFTRHGERLVAELERGSVWQAVLDAEPGDADPPLAGERLDRALEALADFADLKTPFTLGHSRGVAELAAGAGEQLSLAPREVSALRRAGLVHDLGRAGVSNALWEKRGALTDGEWEAVRLHAYYTERTLQRAPGLAALGRLAALHHERLDGSGYHRGADAAGLSLSARLLAAADAFQAMREPRPHRPARTPDDAASELRAEVRAGRLDAAAVDAVLAAAGRPARKRRTLPAGLTQREAQVLALTAQGLRNREIADRLVISPKTVGRHLEHVYAKAGVSTRAAAAVFALQHDLLRAADTG